MASKLKKLTCIVTGRVLAISPKYYEGKVEKAGDEKTLIETYICREAKKLLKLGNSVKKVRELLNATDFNQPVNENLIHELVFKKTNKKRNKFNNNSDFITLSSITHNQTDPEVKAFINKIKHISY